jgi:hypothetical protein
MENPGELRSKRIALNPPLPNTDNGLKVNGFVENEIEVFSTMTTHTETPPVLPTEEQIEETLRIINDIPERPEIDLLKNAAVKEGYDLAAEILAEDIQEYEKADFARVKSVQGRAIAALAIDYLIGECEQKVLVGVPVKK